MLFSTILLAIIKKYMLTYFYHILTTNTKESVTMFDHKAYRKAYYESHKDYFKAYRAKWREEHPTYDNEYWEKNKDTITKRNAK